MIEIAPRISMNSCSRTAVERIQVLILTGMMFKKHLRRGCYTSEIEVIYCWEMVRIQDWGGVYSLKIHWSMLVEPFWVGFFFFFFVQ